MQFISRIVFPSTDPFQQSIRLVHTSLYQRLDTRYAGVYWCLNEDEEKGATEEQKNKEEEEAMEEEGRKRRNRTWEATTMTKQQWRSGSNNSNGSGNSGNKGNNIVHEKRARVCKP